ncbi:hypothetical protein [Truepera radiovictrix]|uniref:Uncharacterized protein n=1 Tax=Truepera radiovictrix (strain DSM 17093 / CIP 108686 / LMG 22925 / RQ-24) TaxID=649638 RepID=D7CW23_TRURR|nr:hypothetical protein [Truepera radiovictrix]ADI14286.1 hypothetical protein Trad_1161 [Truepera radiovictrix DSM 17093]WMT57158.1 hypothetical protein RCV51_14205 [Truepera radiovictrix]
MRRLCRGVAFVVADPERRAAYAATVAQNGPKVFGAPMRAFATLREAEAWLTGRLLDGDAPRRPAPNTQEVL